MFPNTEEQKAICAQQENPFVENKPYSPNAVMEQVITHLMDGLAPAPGDKDTADYAKRLYIATVETLLKSDMPVNESSIVKMKDEILSQFQVSEQPLEATQAEESTCYAKDIKESVHFQIAGKSLTVKKEWIKYGVIALLILILIKLIK